MHADRRSFLADSATGLGGIALSWLLGRDGSFGAAPPARGGDLNGGLHHRARAKRVVQLFMSGAASQCDTFDYKPLLIKRHGEAFNPGGKVELFQSSPGPVMKSPWKWKRYGDCGKWVSDLFPHVGGCADKIAFVHSMVSKSNVHGPATFLQATGFVQPGFPSMGAWVGYGLGSMTDDLPAFVVLPDPRGFAPNGPANWGAGFLPATHQGVMVRPADKNPIADLFPPDELATTPAKEAAGMSLLEKLNRTHAATRHGDSRLDARIAGYRMAARLQRIAPEVLDITRESRATRRMYGLDDRITEDMGRSCLVARRLLERGVRFVQVWSGADNGFPRRNWDSHEDIARDHGEMGTGLDRPAAALIRDLEARGLLDDTVILWTTEFGRMPCGQGLKGRDHNPFTFTNWLAGGGIKGGTTYGASDEWSFRTVGKPTTCYDVHATVLHLLGIDHERLSVRHNGTNRRLTDVHGHVIEEIVE